MTEIVKVQLPLFSTHGEALALIYDRKRQRIEQSPVSVELREKMQPAVKAYFHA